MEVGGLRGSGSMLGRRRSVPGGDLARTDPWSLRDPSLWVFAFASEGLSVVASGRAHGTCVKPAFGRLQLYKAACAMAAKSSLGELGGSCAADVRYRRFRVMRGRRRRALALSRILVLGSSRVVRRPCGR